MESKEARRPAKLLVAIGNEFGYGGIEAHLINTFRENDDVRLEKHLYTPCAIVAPEQGERLRAAGFRITAGGNEALSPGMKPWQHLAFYRKMARGLRDVLRSEKFDAFYANPGNVLTAAVLVGVARRCGVPVRIVHAHNTELAGSRFKEFVRACCRRWIVRDASLLIGCSRDAAIYFFGSEAGATARVIHCGIDARRFAFREDARARIRGELGWEDCLVVGHVGRFEAQKNHPFLLRTFRALCEKEPSARLMLFGRGEMEPEMRALARELGIESKVLFMGSSDRIQDYLCAMDVFALPSLFEGLGIVNIEAQASGLPCVVSDAVPREARVTEFLRFVPLNRSPEQWADELLSAAEAARSLPREEAWKRVVDAGFDLRSTRREICDAIRGSMEASR